MLILDAWQQRAERVIVWLTSQAHARAVPTTPRCLLALASYDLALEHHRAVLTLVAANLPGSALAMLRPALEAFLRGHWLLYVATEAQIDLFARQRHAPSLDTLIRALAEENSHDPQLAELHAMVRHFHRLTHGSVEHLVQRLTSGGVRPDYATGDLAGVIELASWVGVMAALDVVGGIDGDAARATLMLTQARALLALPQADTMTAPDENSA